MGSLKEDQSAPSSKHDDVQTGRILYISENAAEYLGHSMEDLLIHGDRLCHHPHQHKHQHHPQHHHQSISFSKCMIVIQICCSIYDIVDKQDHPTLHLHLARYHPPPPPHCHHFHHHQYHHHQCHHPHNHDDGQGGRWWERERAAKVNLKSQAADFPLQVKPVRLLIKHYHHGDHIISHWSNVCWSYCQNHTIYIWE